MSTKAGQVHFCEWDTPKSGQCGCSKKLKDHNPALYEECIKDDHRICSVWAVRDVDCPKGECYGFGVKLGSEFDYAKGRTARPAAGPFPRDENWSVAFQEAPPDLAGAECQPKGVDIAGFSGKAEKVDAVTGGSLALTGTFSPATTPAFNLANAQNVTLNLAMHELPPTADELVQGYGTTVRPFPLNLARIPGDAAIFRTVDGIAPAAQITVVPQGEGFKFTLRVDKITIHKADECPKSTPVELMTSFNIFGVAEPVDVHIKGKWDCRDTTKPYTYKVIN